MHREQETHQEETEMREQLSTLIDVVSFRIAQQQEEIGKLAAVEKTNPQASKRKKRKERELQDWLAVQEYLNLGFTGGIESVVAGLQTDLSNERRRAERARSEDRRAAAKEEVERFEDIQIILESLLAPSPNIGGFAEWERIAESRNYQRWKFPRPENVTDAAAPPLQQDVARQEAVKTREIQEKLLLDTIFEIGGLRTHTSWPADISPKGYPGFVTAKNELADALSGSAGGGLDGMLGGYGIGTHGKEQQRLLRDAGIHELCTVLPVIESIYEKEEIAPARKGLFGIGKRGAQTKTVLREERKLPWAGQGYQGETVVELKYTAFSGDEQDTAYRDYSGRHGNTLVVSALLPETVARQVQEAIQQNPAFIRQLARRAVQEGVADRAEITDDLWEHGTAVSSGAALSPPYGAWKQKYGEHRIKFITGDKEQPKEQLLTF